MNRNHLLSRKPVIFCDFDGTITENDNVVQLMEHFKPPGIDDIVKRMKGGRLSIRAGVEEMFALFPASSLPELTDFALDQMVLRSGFSRLLEACHDWNIDFLVTSGGVDFMIAPALQPFGIPQNRIYCNRSDTSDGYIRIVSDRPCDGECQSDCGMCKSTIMRSYPKEDYLRIMIGDSYTDFVGATHADIIFARSHLLEECEKQGLPYYSYETFDQVTECLAELLKA